VGGTATAAGAFTFVPAPTISSVSPAAGPEIGGTTVTITGTNLTGATSVSFGGVLAASFTVDSDTQITAATPAIFLGTVAVSVSTVGGSATALDAYTYVPCPGIVAVNPIAGSDAGGATVTIFGLYFTGTTSVSFGGVPAASFTIDSDMQITAVTPAGTAGAADVEVVTAGGTATAAGWYTYVPAPTISTVVPNAGPEVGSVMVIITGTNLAGATSVSFGAAPAVAFIVDSDTQITAIAGPGTGTVDISISTAGGTVTCANAFTYIPVPVIVSVSPNAGPEMGGTTVTITGVNLSDTSLVLFGPVPAVAFTVDSDTQITAITPAGFGVADVTVLTTGGPVTSVGGFMYVPAPIITFVTPMAGPEAGGATVVIEGMNLAGATSVTFGGVPATSFIIVSYTQIVATVPAGSGAVDVTVATAGGSASAPGIYAYVPAPTVSDVSPTTGSVAGGETVTITGTSMASATSVTFDGIPAISFTIDSATQITAITPVGIPGTVNISVVTAGGAATAADAYTYYPVPLISFVLPATGPDAGGASVTIAGLNLTGTMSVTIGGAPATFMVDSDTQISAVTPAGTPGMANITVATPGGVSTLTGFYMYVSAPTIASVTPAAGPEIGGVPVIITGTSFTTASSVTFDGVLAVPFTIDSDTQIVAFAPAGTGTVDVSIVTAGGSATAVGAYTYVPAPVISSVSPAEGPEVGGTTVTITGTGLSGAMSVSFDGIFASFTVLSDTQIQATTPAGAGTATVDVSVSTAGGTATSTGAYAYVPSPQIISISPLSGLEAGGTTVTVTGTNFTSTTSVTFAGTPATFTVDSAMQVTATTPAGTPGAADVAVTTAGGSAIAVGAYTYLPTPDPTITSVSPTEGYTVGGTTVIITGTDLTGAMSVSFGEKPATSFTVDSATQITAMAPAGTAGAVDVSVTTAGGTATAAGAYTYVALPTPTITSVTPTVGPAAGGATVVITGTDFAHVLSVTFGGASTTYTVDSSTKITATTPAGIVGTAYVSVTTEGGTATAMGAYTYAAVPTIYSVFPNSGSDLGGSTVIIDGTGFTGATAVKFGGVDAWIFTVDSDSQITAMTPSMSAGTVDVAVTTPGGTGTRAGAYQYVGLVNITSFDTSEGFLKIFGTGFTNFSDLQLNGESTYCVEVSDTEIWADMPVGLMPGTVSVVVTAPAGTATGSFTYQPM
jgi:hypothetical protein